VADSTGLGMTDYSTGRAVVREAGTLSEPLGARLRRMGKIPEIPKRPETGRVTDAVEVGGTSFDLPPAGPVVAAMVALLAVVILLFFGGCFGTMAFGLLHLVLTERAELPPATAAAIEGALVLALLGVWGVFFARRIRGALSPKRVIVSPDGLEVGPVKTFAGKWKRIPAREIEELVVRGGRLIARSDRQTIDFGGGLEPAEAVWLHAVICNVLAEGA